MTISEHRAYYFGTSVQTTSVHVKDHFGTQGHTTSVHRPVRIWTISVHPLRYTATSARLLTSRPNKIQRCCTTGVHGSAIPVKIRLIAETTASSSKYEATTSNSPSIGLGQVLEVLWSGLFFGIAKTIILQAWTVNRTGQSPLTLLRLVWSHLCRQAPLFVRFIWFLLQSDLLN